MRLIYHIVSRASWQQMGDGPYAPESLVNEGFVHCSNREQVEKIARLFYGEESELLVLVLDVGKLSEVRDEMPEPNPFPGETFPHVYGAIPREAIVEVKSLWRGDNGEWRFEG